MEGDTVMGTARDALLEGCAPWQSHKSLRGLQPNGDPCQSKDIPMDKPCWSRHTPKGAVAHRGTHTGEKEQ